MESIADVLITKGWHQGSIENPVTGAPCIMGAAEIAVCGEIMHSRYELQPTDLRYRQLRAATIALENAAGDPRLAYWNDLPERTFDEVLRVAKEADAALEGLS